MILFYDDWNKYPRAILHLETKNESFLRLANLYKKKGVKNHAFFLALTQPELANVDPHSEDLTMEQMGMILKEVTVNPWYFFREVARVPPRATPIAEPFRANRANIAMFWSFYNHVMVILIQPRQTGKSLSSDMLNIHLLNYGTLNTQINLLTRSDELRSENLKRLKDIQDELPWYLDMRTKGDIFNTEQIQLKKLGNSYKGHLSNMSPKLANNVGRGFTSPIFQVDEACFVPNIQIALSAALMAGNAARENAKRYDKPYGTLITTTAGKIDEQEGNFIYKLWNSATVWDEHFLDCKDRKELYEVIEANSSTKNNEARRIMVNITMSYRQLGFSDEWMREKLGETLAEGLDADRDLFNRWTSGTSTSPIPKEYLEKIKANIVEDPIKDFYKPFNYLISWYITEDDVRARQVNNHTLVAGIDTSDGIGRDDIAMVVRDSVTGEVVCCATFNEINLITLADFFVDFLIRYENSVMIFERKSSAMTIIDYMIKKLLTKNINPFKRLFNFIVQEKEAHPNEFKAIRTLNYYDEGLLGKLKKYVGFNTSGSGATSRSELYSSTMMSMLKYNAHTLRDERLSHQLLSLIVKNGRIDHPDGGNDDLVIAALLTQWFMIQGRNLSFYGVNTSLLLKENDIFLKEKYATEQDYANEEELKAKEREFLALLEEYRNERNEFVLYKLENKIRHLGNTLVNQYNRSISVEHMLEEINREKRIQRYRK